MSTLALLASTTRDEARRLLARHFAEAGIDSAAIDARVLVGAALRLDHAALVRDPAIPIGAEAATCLEDHAARRARHEPVSRILGYREFWGLPFALTPDVLDPRPDTEIVVAAILARLGARRADPLDILDLGTGSGAILAALLRDLPLARGIGIDRSWGACRVARDNLAALGLDDRAAIIQACWGGSLRGRDLGGGYDVIVSNPPYIEHDGIAGLDEAVKAYDPLEALDGGADGLEAYRALVPDMPRLARPRAIVAFEIGWRQGAAVTAMLESSNFASVFITRDLAGRDRVVLGQSRSKTAGLDE